MSLGEEMTRGWTLTGPSGDNGSLGAVSLGLATVLMASGAGAQENSKQEPTPLPPLEVTAKKAPAKKKAVQKSSPAPVAAPAPVQAEQTEQPPANPDAAFTPGSGNSLQAGTGIGRLPGSVQEQPQVVNVIPQAQLRQQNTTSVEQALRNVPGVTVAIGEGGGGFNGDQFRIRGFEAKGDLYLDGLRDAGVYVRDSFATEEVQVLKGPSSQTFGSGTTGGVINLRQKSAHLGDSSSFDFSVGTDNLYRGVIDVNKQVNSTTAMRGVALYHSQDMADRDHVESERWGFLGSIGMGLGTDTTWVVNYLHQSGQRTPDYGVPNVRGMNDRYGGPVTEYGVPRSTFYGKVSDHDETDVDIITSRFQHEVNDGLTLFNDTRLGFYQRDFATTVPGCATGTGGVPACADVFLGGGNPNVSYGGGNPAYKQEAWTFQNVSSAIARFEAGGLKHEAVAGLDIFYQEDDRPGWQQAGKPTTNTGTPIRNPDLTYGERYPLVRDPVFDRSGDGTEVGLFASDRVWFTPELSVIGGIRWTWFENSFQQPNAATPIDRNSEGDYWSPRASVIWEPTKAQTYYVSWGRSASPVGSFITNSLNPIGNDATQGLVEENESYEAGLKYTFLDGRLGFTAAVFQVDKNNAVAPDPATGLAVLTGEEQRVRGVEFGVTGSVTRAWVVAAGYTYLDSEILDSATATNIGNKIGGVPDNAFSIWTTYNLSESIISGPGKWTIGGGILYQSDMFSVNNSANQYVIPELFSLDAMLAYENDGWRFAVNGYNLTNELNYDQSFNNRATPSAGTTAVFSVGKKF